MNKKLAGLILTILVLAAVNAEATPTLGVATDTGIYAYTDSTALSDVYINYFANKIAPCIAGYEGFIVGPSGSYLTVFSFYNPSPTPVYLIANSGGNTLPMTFGGSPLVNMGNIGQADGYKDFPYYGLLLPQDLSKWTTHEFEPSKTFYLYKAQITYTGKWEDGYYFFAGAETNVTPGLQYAKAPGYKGYKDDFSPKTTSAGGHTPEPVSMALFGMGLFGFGVFFKKGR